MSWFFHCFHLQKIEIKKSSNKNGKRSYAIAANSNISNANNAFNIVDRDGSIVVNDNQDCDKVTRAPSQTTDPRYSLPGQDCSTEKVESILRILPRTNDNKNMTFLSADASSVLPQRPTVKLDNDSNRSQFGTQLRILNRPNVSTKDSGIKLDQMSIQQKLQKSFEEKKAEYAKARLRILGEEMPEEDKNSDVLQSLTSNDTSSISSTPALSLNMKKLSQSSANAQVTAIREPSKPDGTKGFQRR